MKFVLFFVVVFFFCIRLLLFAWREKHTEYKNNEMEQTQHKSEWVEVIKRRAHYNNNQQNEQMTFQWQSVEKFLRQKLLKIKKTNKRFIKSRTHDECDLLHNSNCDTMRTHLKCISYVISQNKTQTILQKFCPHLRIHHSIWSS